MIAITRAPSPAIVNCELTYVEREVINYHRALEQHAEYRRVLADCGAAVSQLSAGKNMPDSVFVEDTALVLDEIAVLASMGAASRREEPVAIEEELRKYREVIPIRLPALLDGGDVVVTGRSVLVGLSSRTDGAGATAISDVVSRYGYQVRAVRVTGCLHLKSACTALPDGSLLVNPAWLSPADIEGFSAVEIEPDEPFAADVALAGEHVIAGASFPRTNAKLEKLGFSVRCVDLSEFAKAEGGVTCLSLIFTP